MKRAKLCPTGTQIQSVIFSKANHTKEQARFWLERHNFHKTIDEKTNTLRARQKSPSAFRKKSFRTITLTPGIDAVIGCPTSSGITKRVKK